MKIFPKFFSPSDCRTLLKVSRAFDENHAKLDNRNIYFRVINKYNNLGFVKDKLKQIGITNNPTFNITCYKKGSFFLPHRDRGGPNDMKSERLSTFIIQLSDTEDYEGGNLIVNGQIIPREIGTAVQFDGSTLHELQEVTEGTRYSAVFWLSKGHIAALHSLI